MKVKVMTIKFIKVTTTILGIGLFFYGFLGFFISFGNMHVVRVDRFYEQVPVHGVSMIAVDTEGNTFFGSSPGLIQVYDNTGAFLYGFSFPTDAGVFSFYIDDDDIVRVAVARGSRLFSFENGYLIESERFENVDMVSELRNRRHDEFVDSGGNIYRIHRGSVRMYDENGNFIRTISPNASIRPLHPVMMFGIALTGIFIVIMVNWRLIFRFAKSVLESVNPQR